MNFLLSLVVLLFYGQKQIESGSPSSANVNTSLGWGYKKGQWFKSPIQWKDLPETYCAGKRQSPIDISTQHVKHHKELRPIIVEKLNELNQRVSLEKHAYTIYLNFNKKWRISFGHRRPITPIGLHWHWGSNDNQGSEHRMNGDKFPLEAHLVSYNSENYSTFANASVSPNGLHVIGIFYKIGRNNSILDQIIEVLQPIINNEYNSVEIDEIHPRLILPMNIFHYYRYEGSLTTPPCTENVVWTIMSEVQEISKEQISFFRKLQFESPEHGHMMDNFRPIGQIYESVLPPSPMVYASFSTGSRMTINMVVSGTLLIMPSII